MTVDSHAEPTVQQVSATPASLGIMLRPSGDGGSVDRIEVEIAVSQLAIPAGEPALALPIRIASVPGCDIAADAVFAADALGPLTVSATDDDVDPTGFGHSRRFAFDRATQGEVRIRYTAKASPVSAPRRSGPPFDLICQDGGMSAAGATFLLLPASDTNWHVRLEWDLTALPPGASAVSSLGDGAFELVGSLDRIKYCFYMVGDLAQAGSQTAVSNALKAYWLGTPRFNASGVMTWLVDVYAHLAAMLPREGSQPFRVMGRLGSLPVSGGAAMPDSFMIGYGREPESEMSVKFLLAHELSHPLAGSMDGMGNEGAWYAEGLAEFYKLMVPLRAGLVSDEDFLVEFAKSTRGYYMNPNIDLPNAAIEGLFWSDSQVRKLPYQRGLLYFLELDWQLRRESNGSRTLETLINQMNANRRMGRASDLTFWRELVGASLGEAGLQAIDNVLSGAQPLVPPSEIFGDDFERRTMTMQQYVLGFAEKSFQNGRIEGLIEASAASIAGIREGDQIVSHDYSNRDRELEPQPVTLCIEREGNQVVVQYVPGGVIVEGFEWVKAGAPVLSTHAAVTV